MATGPFGGGGDGPGGSTLWRWVRLAALGGAGAGVVVLVLVAPVILWVVPRPVRMYPAESAGLALVAAHAVARRRGRVGPRFEIAAERALDRHWPAVLAVLIAGLLAGWLPHYLTWPWSRDTDTFAVLARQWDLGVRPYRDVLAYNFPGHTYLHWLIGRTAGWGRTWTYYAVDVAGLIVLVCLLAAWGRRGLGGVVPGLTAALGVVFSVLNLSYETAAQRDGHVALLVIAALVTPWVWPGRRAALWGSALLTAAAFTVRPHTVLFLPALLWSARETAAEAGGSPRRAVGGWLALLALGLALGFAPLLPAGMLVGLARGLRVVAYGGPYSQATPASALETFGGQFREPWLQITLAGTVLAAGLAPGRLRRQGRIWVLAVAGGLLYRPLHPVQHDYLGLPLMYTASVCGAVPLAWVLACTRLGPVARLAAALLVTCQELPRAPAYWNVPASARALASLAGGPAPPLPPGVNRWISTRLGNTAAWPEYQAALAYLERTTGPDTVLANVNRRLPFLPFNGPTGRRSPFLAESGVCILWLARLDLQPALAAQLEAAGPGSVVVWTPDEYEPRMELEPVAEVVRRLYRPEARFGPFEIGRRPPARNEPNAPAPIQNGGSRSGSGSVSAGLGSGVVPVPELVREDRRLPGLAGGVGAEVVDVDVAEGEGSKGAVTGAPSASTPVSSATDRSARSSSP